MILILKLMQSMLTIDNNDTKTNLNIMNMNPQIFTKMTYTMYCIINIHFSRDI